MREMPAIVIGHVDAARRADAPRVPRATSSARRARSSPRPPSRSVSRIAGCSGSSEKSHGRPVACAAHRQHPRIVGVQHVPPVRARDPRDRRAFTSASWSTVSIPVQAEVVLAHVRDDGDVVVPHADAAQQHAAARGLEHRDVGRPARAPCAAPPNPRVVAAPRPARRRRGRRRRSRSTRRAARRAHQVREQPDRRGLPVRAGHLDDGDVRVGHVGSSPGLGRAPAARPASATIRSGERRQQRGHARRRPRARGPRPRRAGATGTPPTIWSRSGPGRARTASRRAPAATASRRVSVRGDPRHDPAPLVAAGAAGLSRPRHAELGRRPSATRSSEAASQPGTASVSLTAGRGK